MRITHKGDALGALAAILDHAGGAATQSLAEGIAKAVKEGNTRDRLAGVSRYGTGVNKLKGPRTGEYKRMTGPPMAPRGTASRVISAFKSAARKQGGKWQIVAGWEDSSLGSSSILTKLDKTRPIFGVSPASWVEIRKLILQFKSGILKKR